MFLRSSLGQACGLFLFAAIAIFGRCELPAQDNAESDVFRRDNLVAWCIVPFDSQKRTPEQRAEMLDKLGIKNLAYDYRAEHIPTFDDEIEQLQKRNIQLSAWWFPGELNAEAQLILDKLQKHGVHPQLWITGGGAATSSEAEQRQRVQLEAKRIRPIAEAAAKIGCQVGLYNHGGWFGEPENQLAIIDELKLDNVGIVYNLHHGHEHVPRFAELLRKMKPHLLALNLNGMVPGGDQQGQKILPLGAGTQELELIKIIAASGYSGPIGILNHTDHDAEARLLDNLEGLEWLLRQAQGEAAGQRPKYRTWAPAAKLEPALGGGKLLEGLPAFRTLPLTATCIASLADSTPFNILVANDTKASGEHWEMFTQAGSGRFAVYTPGYRPELTVAPDNVCDSQPHRFSMIFENQRLRLYVDQRLVADQAIERTELAAAPGKLAIGRLVEGTLNCTGQIESVHLFAGVADITRLDSSDYRRGLETLGGWEFAEAKKLTSAEAPLLEQPATLKYEHDPALVERLTTAIDQGNAAQGVALFASAKSACLSCHQIGEVGGQVGPALTRIGVERTPLQLTESVLWPNHHVEDKYKVTQILTADGEQLRGYALAEDAQNLVLRDPSTGEEHSIPLTEIEARQTAPSLMPDGLVNAWTHQQQSDLLAFLSDLGHGQRLRPEIAASVLEHAQAHDPTPFAFDRQPLHAADWPSWQAHVNRDRLYDFYTKEANYFRTQDTDAQLLMEYPGLDGGPTVDSSIGHWGNQAEPDWAGNSWNEAKLGSLQAGVFHGPKKLTVPRAVCLQLGEQNELSVCFDPDSWTYPAVWQAGFVEFSTVRHGFVHGLTPQGKLLAPPDLPPPSQPFKYLGFYRLGKRVVFAFRMGDTEYLDAPWVEEGKLVREVGPRDTHSLRSQLLSPVSQWPEQLETDIRLGTQQPYALDTIELPQQNPWNAPMFCGGHDFLPDGSALVATMQGDVWRVSGLTAEATDGHSRAVWRRFASGLHHALGVKVDPDGIFVLGRDQLTRLHDLNGDGEADFYECFSNAYETSPAGHDFICGLERDAQGNFYTASGNQGLLRISPDGQDCRVVAAGFRNPDGLGIYPNGTLTVPCSEGEWTPASMICGISTDDQAASGATELDDIPFFGYRGAKFVSRPIERPQLPMAYIPRGLDNSAGGQVYIDSDRWGPLGGNMLHLSFGTGSHFLLLRDEVEGQLQGAVVPLPGEFLSGVHRGRFSPADGQLYVSGMTGWGNYAMADGCFQRVRYTGQPVQLPADFHLHQNGVALRFPEPLSEESSVATAHFAQAWNYRYSAAYGSAEYSTQHYGVRGHDRLQIRSAHILDEGHTLFLEIPELQMCNQLHLQIAVGSGQHVDMFVTCNRLDTPWAGIANPSGEAKLIAAHPLDMDMLMVTKKIKNPWLTPIDKARPLRIEAGKNLTYSVRVLTARAGEAVALTLANPDVVPHNWALVERGSLQQVGELANRLVADPEALIQQYVPQTNQVLCFTDIVEPNQEFTIYFRAPQQPGRYPFLCTFPGHWMVMNGELVVEP